MRNNMIEILMTATRRPEIIEKTLSSFKKNMFDYIPAKVIINIDPIGPGTTDEIIDIVKHYFELSFVSMPPEANFSKAFKQVWSMAQSRFCLWLEDDWELKIPVSLPDMIDLISSTPYLASLRLPWVKTEERYMKNWKYKFPYFRMNNLSGLFMCPEDIKREVGFCGHPSLLNGIFVNRCAKLIDVNLNPEKQFHHGNQRLIDEAMRWKYAVYAKPNQQAAVEDIGRKWMIENGFKKKGNKAFFQEWTKVDENDT